MNSRIPFTQTDRSALEKQIIEQRKAERAAAMVALPTSGPGTELKALLSTMGIHASPTCKCNKMAIQMDNWGSEESLKHIEEIVDVMEETAKSRNMFFIRAVGRSLVKVACWKANRKNNNS